MIKYQQEKIKNSSLKPYIDCFWQISFDPTASSFKHEQLLLPDGCTELVVEMTYDQSNKVTNVETFFVGHLERASMFKINPNTQMFGLRFSAIGGSLLFPHKARETTEKVFRLDEFAGSNDLCRLGELEGFEERLDFIEDFVNTRLSQSESLDSLAKILSSSRTKGFLNIIEFSKQLGCSRRTLERKFMDHVGVSPKTLDRIWRLQKFVSLRSISSSLVDSELAIMAGYYDHSHFVKEFRAIAGLTPSQYYSGLEKMTESFSKKFN